MIAIRMVERDAAQGYHVKRYVFKGMRFEAGEAGGQALLGGRVVRQTEPSPVYPMEDVEAAAFLTGTDAEGRLNVHQKNPALPVFVVVPNASDPAELDRVLQREMERRARRGQPPVKAEVRPMQTPEESPARPHVTDPTADGALELLRETNLQQSARISELETQLARLIALQEAQAAVQATAKPDSVEDMLKGNEGDGDEDPPAAPPPDPDPEEPPEKKPAATKKKSTKRRKK